MNQATQVFDHIINSETHMRTQITYCDSTQVEFIQLFLLISPGPINGKTANMLLNQRIIIIF